MQSWEENIKGSPFRFKTYYTRVRCGGTRGEFYENIKKKKNCSDVTFCIIIMRNVITAITAENFSYPMFAILRLIIIIII
jgi:hypothetical protein